jgi:hypothetical protein
METKTSEGGSPAQCLQANEGKSARKGTTLDNINVFEGRIISFNREKRKIAIKGGDILAWTPNQDPALSRFKAGDNVRIEYDGERLIAIVLIEAAPPKDVKDVNNVNKNEHLDVYVDCYKECCETVRVLVLQPDQTFDEDEFNRVMDIAVGRAKKDAQALIDAVAGVGS